MEEDDKEKFLEDKYLYFSNFKEYYERSQIQQSIKKEYSAEEAWFVISTYIYGYDIEKKITSKEYINLENKSQQISPERFKTIEKYILPFYDNLLEKGYWDKLAIIRYINKNINLLNKVKYDVIVCDEAQDFCKVELNFILNQSNYLNYDLSLVSSIPIVFAGDSNQTVNPTGFRDEMITSLLFEVLNEFNYKHCNNKIYSPNLNYRSVEHVVNLANFIQYYRLKNLDIPQNCLQESKRPNQNINDHFNIFLDYDRIKNLSTLQESIVEKLKYKTFILPIDQEEKANYKANSDLLATLNELELKTSIESKGAEYKHVVLYGFGEYYLDNFINLESNDKKFEKMYFFNKLYVAITRAKNELIIIDSKKSETEFWKKLVDYAEISNQNSWIKLENIKSKTIAYNPDSISNLIIKSTKNDALENANEDKKLGIDYQNSSRLKVAASQYYRLGNEKEANFCLALAEEYNYNFIAAADHYLKIENYQAASSAFFKGSHFEELERIGTNVQSTKHKLSLIIATIMSKGIISYQEILFLSENIKELSKILYNLKWREAFFNEALDFLKNTKDKQIASIFIETLSKIVKINEHKVYQIIAEKSYEIGDFEFAVRNWEHIDCFNIHDYYKAKVKCFEKENNEQEILIYKNEVAKYSNINKKKVIYQDIIELYKKFNSQEYNSEYFQVVFKAYLCLGNIEQAKHFYEIMFSKVNVYEFEVFYQTILDINDELTTDNQIKDILNKETVLYIINQWVILLNTNYTILENNFSYHLKKLNECYYQVSKKYDVPFKEFMEQEIINLNNDLDEISNQDSTLNHFINFSVKNFRQFEFIEINNLGQFNLILGDNNVGKTSILEALLFTNDQDLYMHNLIFAYIARNNTSIIRKGHNESGYEIPRNFINDFFNNANINSNLKFLVKENRNKWNCSIFKPSLEDIKKEFPIYTGLDKDDYLVFKEDDQDFKLIDIQRLIKTISHEDLIKTQFIPFGKGYDTTLAKSYYENIDKHKKLRNEFLQNMKVFIPKVERVTFDTDSGRIDIEEEDSDNSYPLHQYGEGANKLFRILVQLTLQKNKKLLIDEIDAGIHYSHFKKFWEVILKVAKENNVQVFATTHNLECIQYFKMILEIEENDNLKPLSRIITLQKLNNKTVKAYTY